MAKLSIIAFDGTIDKFIPLGVLTSAAAALGYEVNIFVTGFAILGFMKDKQELPFPEEFKSMAPALQEGLKKTNTKSWCDMIKEAKEIGNVKIYVCSLMASVFNINKDNLDDIVDDIVGATKFLADSEGGQVLFI